MIILVPVGPDCGMMMMMQVRRWCAVVGSASFDTSSSSSSAAAAAESILLMTVPMLLPVEEYAVLLIRSRRNLFLVFVVDMGQQNVRGGCDSCSKSVPLDVIQTTSTHGTNNEKRTKTTTTECSVTLTEVTSYISLMNDHIVHHIHIHVYINTTSVN